MPRTPRLDFPGARHHVMNRGARREAVFVSDAVCAMFLDLLATLPSRFGVELHGYALMPNHFHLMVVSHEGRLSLAMRHLTGMFTARLNQMSGWDGPVFRGRFRNRLVETDAYWQHLLAYLHLNPLRAHLTGTLDDSMWTSHHAYVDASQRPKWLRCDELLSHFGSVQSYVDYTTSLHLGRQVGPQSFDAGALWHATSTAALPALRHEAPPRLDATLALVTQVTGVDVADMLRRPVAPDVRVARSLALWWIDQRCGLSRRELGRHFGVTRQVVDRAIHNMASGRGRMSQAREWMAALEAMR